MTAAAITVHNHVQRDHPDYLRDESRRTGHADSISFPETEEEIRAILADMHAARVPVTVQGARTGITGGAVPDGGHILNLSRMNRMLGLRREASVNAFLLRVQPGVPLSEITSALARKEFDMSGWTAESRHALEELRAAEAVFFPPDPTETTASIGGMVACNASGACTLRYGPTRNHIHGLRMVLTDGAVLRLQRGHPRARGRSFSVTAGTGRVIAGTLPSYHMSDVKNAAGFFVRDDMDLVDLPIGAEGTLGVISEVELRLMAGPGTVWGVTAFLPSEAQAIRLVRGVRGDTAPDARPVARPAAIEFFDGRAMTLLQAAAARGGTFAGIPSAPAGAEAAVYVEYHGADESEVSTAVTAMADIVRDCGGSEDTTWIATNAREMEPLRRFRHAVPEAVNLTLDDRRKREPGLTKLGTDMAVPDQALEEVMALYHRGLAAAGLDYVMFGHIGNNHVHVNILPRTLAEYEQGKQLYLDWARNVLRMGGTVAAEHGVGKLKVALLEEMYGSDGIEQMRAVKRLFDPPFLLNRGNLFAP
jgi:D-lactate dehydrogenase (cytochrome)